MFFVLRDPTRVHKSDIGAQTPRGHGQELLLLHLRPLARVHDFCGIDSGIIQLLVQNLAVFAYQKIHPTGSFVFFGVDAVFVGDISAPIAEQREGYADLIGKGFVRERTVHAHTQNLGVGSFQAL